MIATLTYNSGRIHGKLMLTGKVFTRKLDSRKLAECICECGSVVLKRLDEIERGKVSSCGCLKIKHGMSDASNPLYRTWMNIKNRCYQKSHGSYTDYGGKGLTVCDTWLHDFKVFYEWAISHGWREGLTIERNNNEIGYYPSNCRWTSQKFQNRNKTNNFKIYAFGEIKCLADWIEDPRTVVRRSALKNRLKNGWPPEKAITQKRSTLKLSLQ